MSDAIGAVLDAAEIDARWKPTRTRATICLNSDLAIEIARLEEQLRDLQSNVGGAADPIGPLAEKALQLREQAKASEHEFVFRSIGRLARRDLIRQHPPTKEQQEKVGKDERLVYNPDTFPPALMAASCESVRGADAAWWATKFDEWGDGQVARLWQACIAAQEGVNDTPKAAHAFAAMRSRAESSE